MELRQAIDARPMHRLQIMAVALCMCLNAFDGYDVVAISFAAPGLAAEWGVGQATLGVILSLELLGMAFGSIIIGNLADRMGRRRAIIFCVSLASLGMFASAFVNGILALACTRLVTGAGVGGIYATSSAIVAEWSNMKQRSLNIVLNIAVVSVGVIVGGTIAAILLRETGEWRSVFILGGALTALFVPLTVWLMPESIEWLAARQPAGALDRINGLLARLEMAPVDRLPHRPADAPKVAIATLFSASLAPITIILTTSYFAQIMCYYYLQKWIPKMAVDMGHDPASAAQVLVIANVGCFLGCIAVGLGARRIPVEKVTIVAMILSLPAMFLFGMGGSFARMAIGAALAGFFVSGGVVGLFPIFAKSFPSSLRASGTGFAIGAGRGGAALAPITAGALLAAGFSMFQVSAVIGMAPLAGAALLALLIRVRPV